MTPYEFALQDLAKKTAANGGMTSTQMRAGSGSDLPMVSPSVTSAGVGGINLETGQSLGGGSSLGGIAPVFYGMDGGGGGGGTALGGGGVSNSDAFFNSANGPLKTGQVTSIRNNTASGGSTGGYNSAVLQNLVAAYGKASDQARLDSIAQHDQLMAQVKGTMGKVGGYLDSLGKTGETRIAENEAKARGSTEQDLTSRGLGNTTIRNSLLRGVSKDAEQSRQQLGESLAGQRIGTEMQMTQMFGDALLSRQNVAPGNEYLQLIQQLAQQGGGGGGGGGSGGSVGFTSVKR